MTRALPPCAPAAVLVLGHLLGAGNRTFFCRKFAVKTLRAPVAQRGAPLEHQIVNFNYETVQVTWEANQPPGTNLTFLYRFERKNDSECANYIVHHGRRGGCLLEAEGDEILHFSIWNGTQRLVSRSPWISSYLKPNSPGGLSVLWHQEAVTVACLDLPFRGLLYEIQYKSVYDREWQSQEVETCNVTIQGLDADKCYSFRARATTIESIYGSTTYPSDWTEETHQQRGQPRESCQEERVLSKFASIYGLAALLTLLLLLLCVWKLRRVKRLLVPSVPDPKASFPGLFESHHGNFQEWIQDTQSLAHRPKADDRDPVALLVEGLEVQLPKVEAQTPALTVSGPPCLPTAETESAGAPGPPPGRSPQGDGVLAVGGFVFTMGDNSYVTF